MAYRFWEASQLGERIHTSDLCEERIEDIRREMATIKEALKGKSPNTIDKMIQSIDHPFIPEVMGQPLLDNFKPPQMEMFDDSKDPFDLEAYKTYMNLQAALKEIMCQAFPTMIKGSARVV